MKNIRLWKSFSDIDESYIEEAAPPEQRRIKIIGNKNAGKWGILAASFALAIIVGGELIHRGEISQNDVQYADRIWPVKEVPAPNGQEEIAPERKWEELTISEQYGQFEFRKSSYSTRVSEVKREHIGDFLENIVLESYDEAGIPYTKSAAVFEIKGISEECAVAVQFQGTDQYYAYVNVDYRAENLGDFIGDLNLKENIQFGSVWYHWQSPEGDYSRIEFVDLEDDMVWEILLEDTTISQVEDTEEMMLIDIMSISLDIPILGYENIGLGITEDGYLATNILDTGKVFYIGEEKAQEFVDYVLQNCTGYEIVYITDMEVKE